jgi:hypothetical protein
VPQVVECEAIQSRILQCRLEPVFGETAGTYGLPDGPRKQQLAPPMYCLGKLENGLQLLTHVNVSGPVSLGKV